MFLKDNESPIVFGINENCIWRETCNGSLNQSIFLKYYKYNKHAFQYFFEWLYFGWEYGAFGVLIVAASSKASSCFFGPGNGQLNHRRGVI